MNARVSKAVWGPVHKARGWFNLQVFIGLAILGLAIFTFYQTMVLKDDGVKRDQTVEALSVALTAEQDDKIGEGLTPVAPAASQIVDDPTIVQGKPGKDGVDGKPGSDGSDGNPGPSGPPGAKGDTGAKGDKGDKGDTGEEGADAPTPAPATNGRDGLNGADGKNGVDGKEGPAGQPGAMGPSGPPGPSGAPGESPESFTFTLTSDLGTQTNYNCTRASEEPDYTCSEVSNG